MTKKYFLCEEFYDLNPGDTLYEYEGNDYGVVADETWIECEPHIAVSSDSKAPFYVVPARYLIEVEDIEVLTEEEFIAQSTQY